MFFHSPTSLFLFLPCVFIFYPLIERKSFKFSKIFLLIFSLIFYGFNHPWFIIPLLFSAYLDFLISKKLISKDLNNEIRLLNLIISITVNIGLLTLFKYIPFIEESFLLLSFKNPFDFPNKFNFILPAGISFYTFQTLSYVIDAFKGKIIKSPKAIDYFLYVSYFPQLVAGPILRPSDFFDEKSLCKIRSCNSNFTQGFQRICFGLFLKLCLADELSRLNDVAFNSDFRLLSSLDAWTMAFGFGLQIYFDFSGYSHMAIGISRIIGLPIRENFCFPYQSKSATEFWRKWHISLSSWVSDYLYSFLNVKLPLWFFGSIPLLFTWAIMGLWHGSSWRYVVWGILNGVFVLIHRFYKDFNSNYKFLKFFSIPIISWSITIFSTMSTWIYFRSTEWNQANTLFLKLWKFDFNLSLRENYYLFVFMFFLSSLVFGLIWQNKNLISFKILLRNRITSFLACSLCLFFSIIFIERQIAFVYFQF